MSERLPHTWLHSPCSFYLIFWKIQFPSSSILLHRFPLPSFTPTIPHSGASKTLYPWPPVLQLATTWRKDSLWQPRLMAKRSWLFVVKGPQMVMVLQHTFTCRIQRHKTRHRCLRQTVDISPYDERWDAKQLNQKDENFEYEAFDASPFDEATFKECGRCR